MPPELNTARLMAGAGPAPMLAAATGWAAFAAALDAQAVELTARLNSLGEAWTGGGSDKAIERAARYGDGWAPFFAAPTLSEINRRTGIQSIEHLGTKIAECKSLREKLGKTSAFDFAIGTHQRPKSLSPAAAESLLEEFDRFARVGVSWTWIDPPHDSRAAWLEHVDWFGREVAAKR